MSTFSNPEWTAFFDTLDEASAYAKPIPQAYVIDGPEQNFAVVDFATAMEIQDVESEDEIIDLRDLPTDDPDWKTL